MNKAIILAVFVFVPTLTLAWGGRGHHVICSAAVHLVEEKGLRDFLKHRPHTMGHLCNVPDIYWKSLGAKAKAGDPAHFIDPEVTGMAIKDLPADYATLEKDFTGKENKFKPTATIFSVPEEVGSLWWRADQFFRRVVSRKEAFSKAVRPKGREAQNEDLPYNREVYDLMVNFGLMGHFVGDAGQPLHNTADYDGYGTGNGGLHGYYEEQVVAEAPADLEGRIAMQARKIRKAAWLEEKSVVERMRSFSETSAKDLPTLRKKDPIRKKSQVLQEKGMDLRTAALREPASVGWDRFGTLITGQMARSARLLAKLWDEAYVRAGRPDLSAYRSYRYPFTRDFVPLDYVQAPTADPSKESPSK